MSVSSISSTPAPLPFNYLDNNTQPAGIVSAVVTPDTGSSNDTSSNNDASQTLPPTPAPLPPGQGTRIDQLV
jgi:hypothetical protein